MSNIKFQKAQFALLSVAFSDLCEAVGQPTLREKYLTELTQLEAKREAYASYDGRAASWNEERRAEFGKKIAQSHAKKRAAAEAQETWYAYQYTDATPLSASGLDGLAKLSGLVKTAIGKKLSEQPLGFITKSKGKGKVTIYAKSVDDMDKLRHAVYHATQDYEQIIHLPKSPKH